jgi:hypothetical protein
VGIWQYGDYAHVVLGRYERLTEVALRKPKSRGISRLKEIAKIFLQGQKTTSTERSDYLGMDLLYPSPRRLLKKFRVPAGERRRMAVSWRRRRDNNARS